MTATKRYRVSVDVDAHANTTARHLAGELARRCVAAVASSEVWKVHGVSVLDVSTGTAVGRWEGSGREYKRVDVETGEVLP